MKKLVIAFAACAVISLTGCGSDTATNKPTTTVANKAVVSTTVPTTTPATTPKATAANVDDQQLAQIEKSLDSAQALLDQADQLAADDGD